MPVRLDNADGHGDPLRQVVNASSDGEFLEHLIETLKISDHAELLTALDKASTEREMDIENICTKNHHEFVGSVTGLDRVRQDFTALGAEIVDLVQSYQSSTDRLAAQKKNLVDSRNVRQNIDQTSQTLKECLEVLRLANQVYDLVGKQNHYAALRALDEMQLSMQLHDTSRYQIGALIENSIPATQKMIAEAVMDDLNTWLYRIRDVSQYVGEVAFYHTEQRRARQKERVGKDRHLVTFKLNSPVELVADEVEEYDVLNDEEAQLFVDFTPLYECFHIHEALGQTDRFRSEYAATRRKQRDLLMPHSLNVKDEEVLELKTLLENITGFAIVERATLKRTEGLRTNADVEELWDSMCQGAVNLINGTMLGIDNADILLRIIGVVSLFIQTMESLNLYSNSMNALLANIFHKYASLLRRHCVEDIQEIISSDDYMPMSVNDHEEYEKVINACWYEPDKDPREMIYPCVLPFSQMYPMCCIDIRDYLSKVYSTPDDYIQRSSASDETVRNSLDDLLCENICQPLVERLSVKYPGQIVQILTNLEHFEAASEHLQKELGTISASMFNVGSRRLSAIDKFRSGKEKAEKRIFELVNSKIDDLVETAEYDWTSTYQATEPSNYMTELTQYLSNVMTSVLLGLSDEIKELCYLDALTHAASIILTLPLDPSVPSISQAALHQLNLDVSHLNQFVSSLALPLPETSPIQTTDTGAPAPPLKLNPQAGLHATPEMLQQTLYSLTQSVALMLSSNPLEFFDVSTRNINYAFVDPRDGPLLLEKVENGRTQLDSAGDNRSSFDNAASSLGRTGTPVGRIGSPTVPRDPLTGTAAMSSGMQNLEARMKAGSERLMRGFRGLGEGSNGTGGSTG